MNLKYNKKEEGFVVPIAVGCIGAIVAILVIALIIISIGANMFSGKKKSSNPTGSGTTTSATLPADILLRINNNKIYYLAGESQEGIPWQMIAAVHYRESKNDPARMTPSGEPNGTVNPDSGTVECPTTDYAACAASIARNLKQTDGIYGISLSMNNSEEDIKNAFLAHNRGGMYLRAGCTWDDSPYVMNYFDTSHDAMYWPNNDCEVIPPATSVKGQQDASLGAWTVYVILKGPVG